MLYCRIFAFRYSFLRCLGTISSDLAALYDGVLTSINLSGYKFIKVMVSNKKDCLKNNYWHIFQTAKKPGVSFVLNLALQFFKVFFFCKTGLLLRRVHVNLFWLLFVMMLSWLLLEIAGGYFLFHIYFIPLKHRGLSTRPVQSKSNLIQNYCFNSRNWSSLMIQTELLIRSPFINVVIQ